VLDKHLLLLVPMRSMGRSVPSWRMRVEDELQNLAPYRRALSPTDREAFDALLNAVRERRTAGGLLPTLNTWQPAVLSMLVGLMSELSRVSARLEALEERHGHD